MTKKTISAGVVVTDGERLLLCHVTGARHWDLPKGKIDPGEEPIHAALRELREETGLEARVEDLIELGTLPYKRDKDLALWLWRRAEMPDPKTLVCRSTFDAGSGRTKTEMDDFRNVRWDKTVKMVVPAMQVVLDQVRKQIT